MAMRNAHGAFCLGFLGSLYMLFTVGVLHIPPATIGVIVALGGLFALAGTAASEPLVRRYGIGATFIGAAVFSGVTSFLHPMAHGSVALCCVFLAAGQIGDFAWPAISITETSLRQSVAPPQVLGRVNSAMNLLFNGLVPAGAFAGGALAGAIGVRTTMMLGAGGYLLSSLWLVFSPVRQLRDLPAATNSATSAVT
jgi:predicted MFS family arabinose efflux permease